MQDHAIKKYLITDDADATKAINGIGCHVNFIPDWEILSIWYAVIESVSEDKVESTIPILQNKNNGNITGFYKRSYKTSIFIW